MMDEIVQTVVDSEVVPHFAGRPEPKPKRKKPVSAIISLMSLIVVIVASIVGSYQWRDTLKIKRVFVEGNRIVPATEIVQLTKVKAGALMYGVDLEVIRKNILSQVYIKSVDVVRELPDALRIFVQERQPIAAISHDRTMFLDAEGVILPPYEAGAPPMAGFDVPFITGFAELPQLSEGQPVGNTQILRAIALLRQARNMDQPARHLSGGEVYHLISEIHVETNGDFVLYSSDVGVKILLGKQDEAKKLFVLKTFWNQFVHQRGADQLHLVDLRFEDQVIARWKDDNKARNTALYH